MVEVDTTSCLTITVNFLCSRCDERIRKDISKLQRQKKIEKHVEYDNYLNKVKIIGFNPERLMEKLQRKACKICMHVRKITMVSHQEKQEQEDEEVINGTPPSPAAAAAAVEQQQQNEEEEEEEGAAAAAAAAEQEEKEEAPPNPEAEEKQEKEEAAQGQQQQQQQQQQKGEEERGGAVDNELEDHPSKWTYDRVSHFPQRDEKDYCGDNIFCEDDATAPCTIL